MMYLFMLQIILLSLIFRVNTNNVQIIEGEQNDNYPEASIKTIFQAEFYAKILKERRKEHRDMIKQMLRSNYEKNFKLLTMAYQNMFEVINRNNVTLMSYGYRPMDDGFPQTDYRLQEATILTLENCCLAAESLLHFPEISYRIFRKKDLLNWKQILNWCVNFVSALPHIIDDPTARVMELLQQEINEELREENYTNPYYKQQEDNFRHKQGQKRLAKKLKKGPQLSGGSKTEL